MSDTSYDLCCFSYLASAKVLKIDKYPQANFGAEINDAIETLSADGPMVAVAAAHLGLKTYLVANPIGNDTDGADIEQRLQRNVIDSNITKQKEAKTPFIFVLSDKDGNREWFSYTPNVPTLLEQANLDIFSRSALIYIDSYRHIRKASFRAIDVASAYGVPIFLNLSDAVYDVHDFEHLKGKKISIIQTSIQELRYADAQSLAVELLNVIEPDVVIITAGSKGAFAMTNSKYVHVPAYDVDPLHVHGAGAAFSAGFAYCYLKGMGLEDSLVFACALGSASCTVENGFDRFSIDDINSFKANTDLR